MDLNLYKEAKAIAEPFAFEEYRKERIQKTLEEGTANRLKLAAAKRKLPKVNKELARKMLLQQEKEQKALKRKTGSLNKDDNASSTLAANDGQDEEKSVVASIENTRFPGLFSNPDFQIDTESAEYKLRHPTESRQGAPDLLNDNRFDVVNEYADLEEDSEPEGRGSDFDSDSDIEREENQEYKEDNNENKDFGKAKFDKNKMSNKKKPKMYEIRDTETFRPFDTNKHTTSKKQQNKSFGQRLEKKKTTKPETIIKRSERGGMVIEVERQKKPNNKSASKNSKNNEISEADSNRERRGVRDLKLSRDNKQKYWRGRPVK